MDLAIDPLVYASACSGIEAATAAWKPLGWRAAWFAEIEPFPCAVLNHHYPEVPNLGDISAEDFADRAASLGPLDVLIGGTPCQSFSVAGKRESLADDRGNLALVFCRLVERLDPWCVLWENVPGVLSTRDNAFGCFLAGLVGSAAPLVPGGPASRWPDAGLVRGPRRTAAWGILDAQHFGLAQRRRRVFVASLRADDWRCPAALLFEPHGLQGDPAPGREEESRVTPSVTPGARRASGNRSSELLTMAFQANGSGSFRAGAISAAASDDNGSNQLVVSPPLTTKPWSDRDCQHDRLVADTLKAHHGRNREDDTYIPEIAHSLRGEGFDASEDGTGRGTPLIPVAFNPQAGGKQTSLGFDPASPTAGTLGCSQGIAVAYQCQGSNVGPMGTLRRGRGDVQSGVPFIVNGANSCAVKDHAREADVSRCLDGTGGFAAGQGGTVVAQGFSELGEGHVTYQETDRAASLRTTSGGGGTKANLIIDAEADRVRVVVRDTWTGDVATDDRWDALWWMEGNGSCDCNRALLFGHPNVREGYCDGCVRYWIVSVTPMPEGCTLDDFNQDYPTIGVGAGIDLRNGVETGDISQTLQSHHRSNSLNAEPTILEAMAVRRLTPVECERLQGFDDGYTDVPFSGKPAADGPRYRAIGNSMAVTVIQWLGRRAAWLRRQRER